MPRDAREVELDQFRRGCATGTNRGGELRGARKRVDRHAGILARTFSMQRADEGAAAQHVLRAWPLVHEVEQRDGDLVVDLLALLGVDERKDPDVRDDELALERERAQLLGQRVGVLYRESGEVRAVLE